MISIAGAYDLNALSWRNLWTPMLIIRSDDDQSVPVQQAIDMAASLESAGIRHKFITYKDRGHMRLTDEVVNEMVEFIAGVEGHPAKDSK